MPIFSYKPHVHARPCTMKTNWQPIKIRLPLSCFSGNGPAQPCTGAVHLPAGTGESQKTTLETPLLLCSLSSFLSCIHYISALAGTPAPPAPIPHIILFRLSFPPSRIFFTFFLSSNCYPQPKPENRVLLWTHIGFGLLPGQPDRFQL